MHYCYLSTSLSNLVCTYSNALSIANDSAWLLVHLVFILYIISTIVVPGLVITVPAPTPCSDLLQSVYTFMCVGSSCVLSVSMAIFLSAGWRHCLGGLSWSVHKYIDTHIQYIHTLHTDIHTIHIYMRLPRWQKTRKRV